MQGATSHGGLLAVLVICATLAGCGAALDQERQYCLECSLRRSPATLDDAEAAAQFREGCDDGDAPSCSLLGVMIETGRHGVPDPYAAAPLYQRACVAGNGWGCINLGRLLESGATGHQDLDGARLTYDLACRGGLSAGCYELGRWYYQAGNVKLAVDALRQGCDAGEAAACLGLGSMYQNGQGLTADTGRAQELFLDACRSGNPEACERLDRARPLPRRPARQGQAAPRL